MDEKNLDVDTFRNGDKIPEARTTAEWIAAAKNKTAAWCYYNNDPLNGKKYGKLYNHYAVIDKRNIMPKGWKVPTREGEGRDFKHELFLIFMRNKGAMEGGLIRKTEDWPPSIYKADNYTGFSALAAGIRDDNGTFENIGDFTVFWLKDDWLSKEGRGSFMSVTEENELNIDTYPSGLGVSIRGVYDQE